MGPQSFNSKIIINEPKRLYTSGDKISGTLVVKARKDASLGAIEVGVRCLVEAHVQIDQTHLHEKERVYTNNVRVFPDDEIADSMTKFTIRAGDHEFPFEFILPNDASLPQSFARKGTMSGVYWYIKAQVLNPASSGDKISWFMPSVLSYSGKSFRGMAKERFKFAPTVPLPDPRELDLIDFSNLLKPPKEDAPSGFLAKLKAKNQLAVQTDIQLTVPKAGLAQAPSPANIGLRIKVSEVNALEVAEIKLRLRSHTRIYVRNRRLRNTKFPSNREIAILTPNTVLATKETNFGHLIANEIIEDPAVGTIDVPNIRHWYDLKADITFVSPHHPNFRKRVTVSGPVDVCPQQGNLPSYADTVPLDEESESGPGLVTDDDTSDEPPTVDFDTIEHVETGKLRMEDQAIPLDDINVSLSEAVAQSYAHEKRD